MYSLIKILAQLTKKPIVLNFKWISMNSKYFLSLKKKTYLPWKGPEMKTILSQWTSLVSKLWSLNVFPRNQEKKIISPGEKADSVSKVGNVTRLTGASCYIDNKGDIKDHWSQVKTHRSQLKEVPGSQR